MINQINTLGEFKPFPAYDDRAAWGAFPAEVKASYGKAAERLKNYAWPSLPATRYMDFYRNGDRSGYEGMYFNRRASLFTLLVAECFAGGGEYIDDIINGVWHICEETTWVIPAHVNGARRGIGEPPKELCDIEEPPFVDLFSAETGALLAWVWYFLGAAIAARAPLVKRRIEHEVWQRILLPYLKNEYYWWFGFIPGEPVMNWNPWINSNALVAYLVFAKTFPSIAVDGVNKAIRSTNKFLEFYAEDGGCDEGPGYFRVAGGSLFDFLEELGHVTDIDYIYREPRVRNIAAYTYKVYAGGGYFVNFADAAPRTGMPYGLLTRVGGKTGDENLVGFANMFQQLDSDSERAHRHGGISTTLYRALSDMQTAFTPCEFKAPKASWFSGIQVMTARDAEGSLGGLYFAAKGGTNGESHNHNDVGNFVLYCDGVPVLVDAGVETYTKTTFSDQRYTLWAMRSSYHNTPTINGFEQMPGDSYRAHNVMCGASVKEVADGTDEAVDGTTGAARDKMAVNTHNGCGEDINDGNVSRLVMDIAPAYPGEANVKRYTRAFAFHHGKALHICDDYDICDPKEPLRLHFLCYAKPEIAGHGIGDGSVLSICLSDKVVMTCSGDDFEEPNIEIDEIHLTDPKIHGDWGKDYLYRLTITASSPRASSRVGFSIALVK